MMREQRYKTNYYLLRSIPGIGAINRRQHPGRNW